MSVELVILVDDSAASDGLRAEHGLSILLSGPRRKLLFDAGPSEEALLVNAAALDVDLDDVDTVVVSHGHRDHTGGLAALVQRRPGLKVYVHSGAFDRRWSDEPGQPLKDISCPHSIEKLYQSGAEFHSVTHAERLASWLLISGPIGGPKHGRDVFVVRKAGEMVVDGFEDEVFLLVRGEQGWAVVTACCHRGLRNTLRTARFLARGEPLVALIGGLHLQRAGRDELEQTVDLFRQHELQHLYPCHCTGEQAVGFLRQCLPGLVHPLSAGSRVVF